MARRNVRVVMPKTPDDIIKLADSIIAKHTADGAASPLPAAEVTALGALVTSAKDKTKAADQLHKDAETATKDRDELLGNGKEQNETTAGTILFYERSFRNLLLGKYLGKENKLGDWSYRVDTSPHLKKNGSPPPTP